MRKTLVQTLLAAFCAILAHTPLEGGGVMLIGMRNAMLAGGGLSAKSYVQDGLVAMWDGIENAGWGKHDPNATVWKDLVGMNDLSITSSGSFNGNALICDGIIAAAWSDTRPSPVTIESVCKSNSTSSRVVFAIRYSDSSEATIATAIRKILSFRYNNNQYYLQFSGKEIVGSLAKYFANANAFLKRMSTSAVYLDADGYCSSANVDCEKVNTTVVNGFQSSRFQRRFMVGGRRSDSSWQSSNLGFVGEVNNVRMYSRALSAAEIAHNYAVDKARFDLP